MHQTCHQGTVMDNPCTTADQARWGACDVKYGATDLGATYYFAFWKCPFMT